MIGSDIIGTENINYYKILCEQILMEDQLKEITWLKNMQMGADIREVVF